MYVERADNEEVGDYRSSSDRGVLPGLCGMNCGRNFCYDSRRRPCRNKGEGLTSLFHWFGHPNASGAINLPEQAAKVRGRRDGCERGLTTRVRGAQSIWQVGDSAASSPMKRRMRRRCRSQLAAVAPASAEGLRKPKEHREPGQNPDSWPQKRGPTVTTREFPEKVGGVDGTRTRGLRRDRPVATETFTHQRLQIPMKSRATVLRRWVELGWVVDSSRTEPGEPSR